MSISIHLESNNPTTVFHYQCVSKQDIKEAVQMKVILNVPSPSISDGRAGMSNIEDKGICRLGLFHKHSLNLRDKIKEKSRANFTTRIRDYNFIFNFAILVN